MPAMERLLEAAIVLLPVAYLLIAVDYGFLFFAGRSLSARSAAIGLRAVIALHLLYLVLLTVRWGQLPAANLSQGLSIVAFSVVTVYAIVEWMGNERSTGFWLVSIAFFFTLLSSVLAGSTPPRHELLHDPVFFGHAVLALLGYASFAVAASYGFLFLRLYRELKAGKFSLFFGKLPPLEVLERMMSGALVVGFVALTGAVVSGLVWAREVLPPGQWLGDTKILATLVTWALYAGALLLRRLRRWQGREVAIASLAGFATVLFSFFAVNLWFSDFHAFH
jgi:ABC-type uncharacterized transport system permease subunit